MPISHHCHHLHSSIKTMSCHSRQHQGLILCKNADPISDVSMSILRFMQHQSLQTCRPAKKGQLKKRSYCEQK